MPLPDFTADAGPMYRFRGRIAPTDDLKHPVLAEVPAEAPTTQDGVAKLRLYDPIDSWGGAWGVSAKEFADALDKLDPSTHTINLHINSPGGEVFQGIAIMNSLRAHPAKVVAVIDGLAASAASFIAAGADEVVMGRNAELMIHDAWGLCVGNAADMRGLADRLDHLSNNIASVYAAKTGGTVADWRTAMLDETWYSAEEAVAAGLADKVDAATEEAAAKNAFDLSVFKHAGRAEAPAPKAPTSACSCGHKGQPAIEGAEHKDECPVKAIADVDEGSVAYWQRRHRMNARKSA